MMLDMSRYVRYMQANQLTCSLAIALDEVLFRIRFNGQEQGNHGKRNS